MPKNASWVTSHAETLVTALQQQSELCLQCLDTSNILSLNISTYLAKIEMQQ